MPFPSFVIDFASGLFGGWSITPFRFVGFTQYFLKIVSDSHCERERVNEAARIALSAMLWYSLLDSVEACFCFVAGKGFELVTLVGIISSTGGVDASRGVGVCATLDLLLYLRFGFGSDAGVAGFDTAVAFFAVDGRAGECRRRFAADSRRSLAGKTLFAGVASAIMGALDNFQSLVCSVCRMSRDTMMLFTVHNEAHGKPVRRI